ncbi:hypothetical protein I0C86_02850 [Plantactinospora sp. S1510]|uniref:DUF3558 domain-containing protein n=1 Tax=Plantactinospora alkalitolerans TaxID=2789879 RepID=A0ABS0GP32_9ACTN|nr:hypothetical protein [Plantactinospora alkalitolerans]MBF9127941.1 hypothetical protein [Plantactinospora alkalitolerans]
MMRQAVIGAAVTLMLAGCTSSANPGDDKSKSPSPDSTVQGSTAPASEASLEAVCDALEETVTLPGDGTVRYAAKYYHPKFATNAPMCGIEPEGDYYEVATKASVFGRARFNYGVLTEKERQRVPFPKYTPQVEKLLALDDTGPLTNSLPCANEPCKNGIHGYLYNFRFETVKDNISVSAEFGYITTDVKGDKKSQYRTQAIEAFKASMEVITAGLE